MKDYLLRFDSKNQAIDFGLNTGFVGIDEDGQPYTTLATHTYAVAIIGPWTQTSVNEQDGTLVHKSDDKHWVLFRDLVGLKVPSGAEAFIVWTSDSGHRPENGPQDVWG